MSRPTKSKSRSGFDCPFQSSRLTHSAMRIGATKNTRNTTTTGATNSQPAKASRAWGRRCHGSRGADVAPPPMRPPGGAVATASDIGLVRSALVGQDLFGGLLEPLAGSPRVTRSPAARASSWVLKSVTTDEKPGSDTNAWA